MHTDGLFIIVEKYHKNGRMIRIVLKSHKENYFMDLSVQSFLERSIIAAMLYMIKAASFIFPTFRMNINTYNLKEG